MDNWDSDLCNEHMKKMLQIKITAAGLALRALSALYLVVCSQPLRVSLITLVYQQYSASL